MYTPGPVLENLNGFTGSAVWNNMTNLVEWGVGTASQEAVSLDKEAEVDILRNWGATVWAFLVGTLVVTDIDTHGDYGFRSLDDLKKIKMNFRIFLINFVNRQLAWRQKRLRATNGRQLFDQNKC